MQQSCSQKTKERCFQQWLFSHQLVRSRAMSPRNGCDMASPQLGLQGADPVSLPAGCARRRQSLHREETTRPATSASRRLLTPPCCGRGGRTPCRASSPGQHGLLPGFTPLLKWTANPLCLVTTASSRACSVPQFPH